MIHVHASVGGVHLGTHSHTKADKAKKGREVEHDTDRTWAFRCDPACETAVIAAHPYAAKAASGVPLTPDEETAKNDLEARSNVEVGKMMQALARIAEDKVREGV